MTAWWRPLGLREPTTSQIWSGKVRFGVETCLATSTADTPLGTAARNFARFGLDFLLWIPSQTQ